MEVMSRKPKPLRLGEPGSLDGPPIEVPKAAAFRLGYVTGLALLGILSVGIVGGALYGLWRLACLAF